MAPAALPGSILTLTREQAKDSGSGSREAACCGAGDGKEGESKHRASGEVRTAKGDTGEGSVFTKAAFI